ncbi:hypothetical protein [Mangrovibacter phragmitis]|uniref:hypothetical protein n=1 Tax=Mangrovibacter phragmitis TaxID=1691903 RepID=UPI00336A3021
MNNVFRKWGAGISFVLDYLLVPGMILWLTGSALYDMFTPGLGVIACTSATEDLTCSVAPWLLGWVDITLKIAGATFLLAAWFFCTLPARRAKKAVFKSTLKPEDFV